MIDHGPWTGDDERHNDACHARWTGRHNRRTGQDGYADAWHDEQCGGCRYWIALQGTIGQDYGACTHARSAFDGRVRFEHDGCAEFTEREDGSFG
ncbi:DUF3027 domain-containing protein [Catellatospora sp. NPDC049609]|uniref:DUF3027 domain-containing protein n=1 Tax=Catellatospora sp. NPDC049609 TaxID=3155505 RepID=UPI00343C5B21